MERSEVLSLVVKHMDLCSGALKERRYTLALAEHAQAQGLLESLAKEKT